MNQEIYWLLSTIINLYQFVIIVGAILSWLVAFNVLNRHNQFVAMIGNFTYSLTEPALRPLRRVIPPLGGMDLTPVVLLIGLEFLKRILFRLLIIGF